MDREISQKDRRRESAKRILKIGVPVVAAAGLLWWVMSAVGGASVKASSVSMAAADRGDLSATISAGGKVVPAYEELINSPIQSRILEVRHRAGDIVEAGTPLLTLDLEATKAAYGKMMDQLNMKRLELQQQLANDRTDLSRIDMQIKVGDMKVRRLEAELANERYLDSIGSGTTDKVREAEFALRSAQLEQEQLRQQRDNEQDVRRAAADISRLEIEILSRDAELAARTLTDADIRAPRRGTVTSINTAIGAQIGQGEKVAAVADLGHFKVEGEVADSYAKSIAPGARATVRIGHTDAEGTVASVAPSSTSGVVNFTINLDCDSLPELRPGLRPDIYIHNGLTSDVVRIPNGSFYRGPGNYDLYVLTSDGSVLELRSVRLGIASMDYVEAISGIAPGETVAISDLDRFAGAKRIKLKK